MVACFEYYAGLGEKLDTSREKDVDVGDSSFRYKHGLLRMSCCHAATIPQPSYLCSSVADDSAILQVTCAQGASGSGGSHQCLELSSTDCCGTACLLMQMHCARADAVSCSWWVLFDMPLNGLVTFIA